MTAHALEPDADQDGPGRGKQNTPEDISFSPRELARIVATYNYTDERGTLLYQVVRYEPKDFRQRRPDGNGGWTWKLDGVPRVLYRLRELLESRDAPVFVTEGEKDTDRLVELGHCATTVASGNWKPVCVDALAGRDCLILEDNDEPGREKALAAAQAVRGIARSIRIVALADLSEGGDVSDWLDADPRGAEKLLETCLQAGEWPAPDTETLILWVDMASWDTDPIPKRKWKNVAHVAGKDWFGSMPEPGPAFYIGAEDDVDEIHIRLADIAAHYGVTFNQLIEGGLRVLCLLGQDATLCATSGKSGRVETTNLYDQLYEQAGDLKPKNISIDTLSRAFAGNEIDRVQVYAFAMHMQALAMVAGGSVTVLSHPSLTGINTGSGLSGSTAWHAAFRFRQYLKGIKATDGEQPDGDLRELEFKKNQYGPTAETIVLRYQRGLFLPEGGMSSLDKLAREQKADEVFLALLARYTRESRNVSDKPTSHNYAPTNFCKEVEARGLRKEHLEAAMRRLFAADKIRVETYGKPSRPYSRLVLV